MRYAGPLTAAVVVAEIVAAVEVAHATSWGLTVLLLIALVVVGSALVRREVVTSFRRARTAGPDAAAGALADAVVRVGGAVLVAVPGFVTAAVGLLLLVPPVRLLAARTLAPRWAARLQPVVLRPGFRRRNRYEDPDHVVIDAEPVDRTVDLHER